MKMGVTLERVQNKFACIIGELCSEPAILSKFAIWLDLRLAEYKAKGAISLDCSGENPEPFWLNGYEKETPARPSSSDFHSTPRAPNRRSELSGAGQRFSGSAVSHSSVPENFSETPVVFKQEEDNDISEIFPISLHRHEPGHDRKRPTSESHESSQSKSRRLLDNFSSPSSEQTAIPDFSSSFTRDNDDVLEDSNDTDIAYSPAGHGAASYQTKGDNSVTFSKGDNSLTFSSQNSLSADESLQHSLAFPSTTSDSSLGQDIGPNSASAQPHSSKATDAPTKGGASESNTADRQHQDLFLEEVRGDHSGLSQSGGHRSGRTFGNPGQATGKKTHISTIPLPKFSSRVIAAVKHNHPFMGIMVQETAYHILMYVDIGSKTEYEELGRRMYAAFPFIERPGTYPWTTFCKKLSQKIRHIRWRQQKSFQQIATSEDASQGQTATVADQT